LDTSEVIELLINSNLTWAAALTIMSVVLRPVLTRLADGLVGAQKERVETNKARVRAEEVRNENEREQTRVLVAVKEALTDNATITKSVLMLLQPLSQLPGDIKSAVDAMSRRADARDSEMRTLQQAIAAMPAGVFKLVTEHTDPQLTTIQTSIAALRQEIMGAPNTMTPDVVREIRGQLAEIARLMNRLSEEGPGGATK